MGSTKTKDGTSVKEAKIRLAQAHSVTTRLAILCDDLRTPVSFVVVVRPSEREAVVYVDNDLT